MSTKALTFPKKLVSRFGEQLQANIQNQFALLCDAGVQADEQRDEFFKRSRVVYRNVNQIMFSIRIGEQSAIPPLVKESELILSQMLQVKPATSSSDAAAAQAPAVRDNRLGSVIEKFTESRLLLSFLRESRLDTLAQCAPANDEEYIGAVLGCAQELARYATGRATEGDIDSVTVCQRFVTELNGKMLEFNFRNGYLRRKYDSLKYSLRTIENIVCELSFIGCRQADVEGNATNATETAAVAVEGEGQSGKRARLEPLFDVADIDAIRVRMDAVDALREEVIKGARDAQKLAKQAVYSTQRRAFDEATAKCRDCEAILVRLQAQVAPHPSLRSNISGCIEEWAEARLFLEFQTQRRLLVIADFLPVVVEAHEYIGGLSDLTGEIGRVAVLQAAKRDYDAVVDILQVDLLLSTVVSNANSAGRYSKKLDAINTNMRKVEDLVYELSLQRLGGRAVSALREPAPAVVHHNGNDDGDNNNNNNNDA